MYIVKESIFPKLMHVSMWFLPEDKHSKETEIQTSIFTQKCPNLGKIASKALDSLIVYSVERLESDTEPDIS